MHPLFGTRSGETLNFAAGLWLVGAGCEFGFEGVAAVFESCNETAPSTSRTLCGDGTAKLARKRLRHHKHPSSEDKSSQARRQSNSGQSLPCREMRRGQARDMLVALRRVHRSRFLEIEIPMQGTANCEGIGSTFRSLTCCTIARGVNPVGGRLRIESTQFI